MYFAVQAEKLLTSIAWQDIKKDLADIVAVSHKGYRERHKMGAAANHKEDAESLEVSYYMFYYCLYNSMIQYISAI